MKETTFSDSSELKMFSLGIVVENNAGVIKVSPIEGMNVQPQGKMLSNKKNTLQGNHASDTGGKSATTEVAYSNHVTAEWLALGQPNRVSAPMVYPNETIMLYKYGNVDKYYWTTFKHEPDLRKGETATYGYSCNTNGWSSDTTPIPMSDKNSVFVTIGMGGVFITTPKMSGPTGYIINLNTDSGSLTIKDDLDNTIKLDSVKGTLDITTKSSITLKAEKRITIDSKEVAINGDLYVKGAVNATGIARASAFIKGGIEAPGTETVAAAAKTTPTNSPNQVKTPAIIAAEQIAVFGKVMSPEIEALLANPVTANAPYLASVTSAVNSAASSVTNAISTVYDPKNYSVSEVLSNTVNSAANAVNTTVNNVVNTATNAVNTAVNNAVTTATNAVTGVVNNAVNTVNTTVNTVNGVVNTAVNTVNNTVGAVNNTINAVTDTTNAVITSATAVNTSITNALDRSLNNT